MAINRKKIIEQLSTIKLKGDDRGIIESFGVYINQLPTSFWNSFADRILSKVDSDLIEATEFLLVNAGQSCGYHTGHGIITSEEWKATVQPMIENTEDVLHGAFAILSAWGWGNAEIVELKPKEKMTVRVYDYYEADIVKYGQARRPKAFMLRGICAAFFALAYSGEYEPTENKVYDYVCVQTKGIECGDEYGEFVITKNTDK